MERLNKRIIFLFVIIIITSKITYGQTLVHSDSLNIDFDKRIYIKESDSRISINNKKVSLLECFLWDTSRISGIIIPINDSLAKSVNFSYSRILSSITQLKLVNDEYKEDGVQLFFSASGLLSKIYTYEKGVLNGKYINYFKNGNIKVAGFYHNGSKAGIWLYYDEAGKVVKKVKMNK